MRQGHLLAAQIVQSLALEVLEDYPTLAYMNQRQAET
jgi:hypothetical protein